MIEYKCPRCGEQIDTGTGAGPCPHCTEVVAKFPPDNTATPTFNAATMVYQYLVDQVSDGIPPISAAERERRKKARKAAKASRKRNR